MTAYRFTARLDELRRTVRRRLVAYGIFAVATGGVAAFLTVILLDWALGLPPLLRLTGVILFLLGFAGASYFWIIKPLRAHMSLEEMAWRLETHFPELRDQLVSAVEFAATGSGEPDSLTQQSISRAEELAGRVRLAGALTAGPLVARAIICALTTIALLALAAMIPHWIRVGTIRYAAPWGPTQWPRSVLIVPLTHDIAVPMGESASVSMRIERGFSTKVRPVVRLRTRSGRVETLGLQRDQDGHFSTTVDSITEDLGYWFEAGDDDTSPNPGRLFTVRRPQVAEATAAISPPAYVPSSTPRIADMARGAVDATVGSRVLLTLRLNKPLPSGQAGLRMDGDVLMPLAASDDPKTVTAEIDVSHDVSLYPELRDEYGFTNHGTTVYQLRAIPDRPPMADIFSPKGPLEVTPAATVVLRVHASDDFGISALTLHWDAGASPQEIALAHLVVPTLKDNVVHCEGSYSWELSPLALKPGDVVHYRLSVLDNRILPGLEAQEGMSQPRDLKIIAEAQLLTQLREDLLVVESQLRQTALLQESLQDRTEELVRPLRADAGLTEAQMQTAGSLAGRESRLAEKTRELVGRLEAVSDRLAMNRSTESELDELTRSATASLREAAEAEMTDAARLMESVRSLPAGEQVAALTHAQQEQREALEHLRAVGRRLSQWGGFQSLVARARELLDRQTELRDETATAGRSLMGKPLSSLTEEELSALKNLERQQRQIAADLDQHLARMREHQSSIAQKDPAGADTIDAALRAERANATSDHAKGAADAISENRTAAAAIDQRSAVESMRKLIASLQERQKRELEELRKHVAEAEDQVAWLMEHQKSLFSATTEAGLVGANQETFTSLAEQQGTLAQNTTLTADDLGAVERTAAIAAIVEQAAEPMQAAREQLAKSAADAASGAQQDAVELLRNALDELRKVSEAAAEEWLHQSLSRIHDDLATMLDAQRAIDHGIGELRADLQAGAKMGRAQTRRATQLAHDQADSRTLLSAVMPDLKEVPVYAWALDRVAKWMDAAGEKLSARAIDDDLAGTSSRIVRELEKLVQAITDTQALPMNEEFSEAERAGDGSSSGQASGQSVPTVAELLVLKAMQQDVAARTSEFNGSFDATDTSESQLKALARLGEDQAELRRLTQLVTEKARKP